MAEWYLLYQETVHAHSAQFHFAQFFFHFAQCHFARKPSCPFAISPNCYFAKKPSRPNILFRPIPFRPITISPNDHLALFSFRQMTTSPNPILPNDHFAHRHFAAHDYFSLSLFCPSDPFPFCIKKDASRLHKFLFWELIFELVKINFSNSMICI